MSIYFVEDKAKSVLFASTAKNIRQFNIKYKDTNIKQHSEVTDLGCVLDKTMSREPMALKVEILDKFRFLYMNNIFLNIQNFKECSVMRSFSNILIMHVHPGTLILLKNKKENTIYANKFIRFCLRLDKMYHIYEEDFRLINWLPTTKRVDRCINTITFKFVIVIWKRFLNFLLIVKNMQEIKLKIPSRKKTWERKLFHLLFLLYGTVYLN